jgi:hypothetical protein
MVEKVPVLALRSAVDTLFPYMDDRNTVDAVTTPP